MAYVAKVTAGGQTGMLVGSTLYGECTDLSNTVAKTVSISGFDTLITGVTIHVKFTYGNTASSPTLKVSSTGAKPIKMYGTTAVDNTKYTSWYDGAIVSFTYDGTNWVMNDFGHYQLDASRLETGTVSAARLPSGYCWIYNNYFTITTATDDDYGNLVNLPELPFNCGKYYKTFTYAIGSNSSLNPVNVGFFYTETSPITTNSSTMSVFGYRYFDPAFDSTMVYSPVVIGQKSATTYSYSGWFPLVQLVPGQNSVFYCGNIHSLFSAHSTSNLPNTIKVYYTIISSN